MDTPDTPNHIRRYRLKLYPTKEQADRLHAWRLMCGDLQNACIERYREVYASEHRTLRRYELSKWITAVRAACPEWRAFPAMTPHLVYGRVCLAYQAMFRLQRAGETWGEPRFKPPAMNRSIPLA